MSADEMFYRIGYKQRVYSNMPYVVAAYEKDDDNIIIFYNDKTFSKQGRYDSMCDNITMQELEAINKKCQELGWIEGEKWRGEDEKE